MPTGRLLLLSNVTRPSKSFFGWCKPMIDDFIGSSESKILFIPFAAVDRDWDEYKTMVEIGLGRSKIQSIHEVRIEDMVKAINEAQVICIGGGNTFSLLYYLQKHDLIEPIRKRVTQDGVPYIGWSAGSNVACPDIGTTNDMPIIWPSNDKALNLFPYNINPHFTEKNIPNHGGESRVKRLNQAFIMKKRSIIALPEGTGIRVEGDKFQFFRADFPPEDLPIIVKVWSKTIITERYEIVDIPMVKLLSDWIELFFYS